MTLTMMTAKNCDLCPRLSAFRHDNREKFPDQWNAPVPSFGPDNAPLLILGLAPGLRGANFSGRPFTGDYAGDLLYETLLEKGFAEGRYEKHRDDGLTLINCRIANAVRCVPPENKPTTEEINTCNQFLQKELKVLSHMRVILSLGLIAHKAVLKTYGHKQSAFSFGHGNVHQIADDIHLVNSYHCSRYNTSTKRLTKDMFTDVFDIIDHLLKP